MIIRRILPEEKDSYEKLARHPLQSWAWGDFKAANGARVERVGVFQNGRLEKVWQVFFHPLPLPSLDREIGYFPRSQELSREEIAMLQSLGKDHQALAVLIEPEIVQRRWPNQRGHLLAPQEEKPGFVAADLGLLPAHRPLFPKYTFWLDLTQSEDQLLANMHSKTRYNIRLAERKGVTVREDNSPSALEIFLDLLFETTQRQRFYLHNRRYFRRMWQILAPSGMAHLFLAEYQKQPLAAWIIFGYKERLFYPYGASSTQHREVMASNLLCWRVIQYGRQHHYRQFDLWGSPGPEVAVNDPWYGFHRFKLGYGPELVEFVGSWDLVLRPQEYRLYNWLNDWRWRWLHWRRRF